MNDKQILRNIIELVMIDCGRRPRDEIATILAEYLIDTGCKLPADYYSTVIPSGDEPNTMNVGSTKRAQKQAR